MARQRSPDRNKAYEIFKEHNGDITNRKIAELLSTSEKAVNEKTVGGWKSKDEWIDKLNGVLPKNERSTLKKDAEYSKKKAGAPKGNKNAVNNRGGAKKGNKNATGNPGGSAPLRNGNAASHGLYRKYLPQEIYDLKEELEEAFNNDPLSILWESIMLQHTQIIHAQRIMFVRNNEDMTKELRKNKVSESGFEEEWEIQFAWDKQASFLNAQSKALSTLSALIRDFDRLANIDDERRAKLEMMQVQIDKIKSTTNNETDDIEPVQFVDDINGELDA
ncbi:phage terminase small subunit [Bacillus thuringiensis]|uniref:phage terminase small subunit n=1 Tax=Bacillus thuringiensis TaxID=1428 RepID=UPI000CD9EEEC|nr:phage terminase small subunit [Bacillus thuringiensis]MEC3599014.1 phage terminase small subunit [Bacillus thuringiensis]MED1834992.1 phage terminase small subunit [Bacillus thuringiensis]MED2669353.1 phage terminase small subunit [Bacillus thuringiensis]MED2695483.1 phage terminase small subunit [Bacillus thuringiensis]MED2711781.1 phage terminase small subunit [Bacillus thuringiensis]